MSATMFELVTKGRAARKVEDLDNDTLRAIANSAVEPEFEPLKSIVLVLTERTRWRHRHPVTVPRPGSCARVPEASECPWRGV